MSKLPWQGVFFFSKYFFNMFALLFKFCTISYKLRHKFRRYSETCDDNKELVVDRWQKICKLKFLVTCNAVVRFLQRSEENIQERTQYTVNVSLMFDKGTRSSLLKKQI